MVPTVTLEGITANVFGVDADGVEWIMDKPDGWDGPGVRVGVQGRPFADGAWVSPGWRSGWEITLKGEAVCPSMEALERARYRLIAATALHRRNGLLTVGESVPKQVSVRLLDQLDTAENGTNLTFQVPLVAADPRKYAAAGKTASAGLTGGPTGGMTFPARFPLLFGSAQPTGLASATNVGIVDTPPVITVTGPAVNPIVRLNETGESFALSLTVGAGERIVIDMAARTVLAGGTATRRYAVVPGSSWFMLRPGANGVRFSADAYNTTATLDVAWRDAW